MSKVIDTAIKALKDGWTQNGCLTDGAGNVCMNMALALALGLTGQETNDDIYSIVDNSLAGQVIADTVTEQYPELEKWEAQGTSVAIYMFNDRPKTTFSDIMNVLDKANVKMEELV